MTWRSQQDTQKSNEYQPILAKASCEPPLEWSKWAAIFDMAVFAKDGIEVRNLQRNRPPLVEPTERIYEV